MKRITHFKGYDSIVEYDQENQTFVSKPVHIIEQQQSANVAKIVIVQKRLPKKVKRQKAMARHKSEPDQQASSFT